MTMIQKGLAAGIGGGDKFWAAGLKLHVIKLHVIKLHVIKFGALPITFCNVYKFGALPTTTAHHHHLLHLHHHYHPRGVARHCCKQQ